MQISKVRADDFTSRSVLFLLGIALALTIVHFEQVDRRFSEKRYEAHCDILSRIAPSPYRYRVLLPLAAHGAGIAAPAAELPQHKGTLAAYTGIQFVSLASGLIGFFFFLGRWFSSKEALIGALFIASMMPMTFLHYYFQPWGHFEFPLYVAGMWFALDGRFSAMLLVVIIASFNRETGIFLPLIYWLAHPLGPASTKAFLQAGVLGAISTGIFVALRVVLGLAPHIGAERTDAWTFRLKFNLTDPISIFSVVLFFGILWILMLKDWEYKPIQVRRTAAFLPVFFVVHLFASHIREVRYFLELAPIVMPLSLHSLFGPSARPDSREAR